jgi:hypothetical protein
MPAEADAARRRERLQALTAEVGTFHLRERAIRRAHAAMSALLESGGEIGPADAAAYLAAVRRYFTGFSREAAAHLGDVERRLTHASQVQFNLAAERGVAVRRVEITQGVLSKLAELGGE